MGESLNPGGRVLVIFDGLCGLCNRAVRWLLRHDRHDRLRFVASESPKVADLVARHASTSTNPGAAPSTLLVVRDAGGPGVEVVTRSDAVVALLGELPRPWPALGVALWWIPRPIRDLGYRLVARWRYRVWGRLDSCPLPTAVERGRFL